MFVAVDLTPLDASPKPSSIVLHPLLAPYDLDEFSLPLSFSVDGQALLHVQDGIPITYSPHKDCDVLHNNARIFQQPRRLHTGDTLIIRSSDAPTSVFVKYTVQIAYFSFSSDPRVEMRLEMRRVELGATVALQSDTTAGFPLSLPLQGKLPAPAPTGTNWTGVRSLISDVRAESSSAARSDPQQLDRRSCSSSSPIRSASETAPRVKSTSYAQIIAAAVSRSSSGEFPATTTTSVSTSPLRSSTLPSHNTSTFPSTSLLGSSTSPTAAVSRIVPLSKATQSPTATPSSMTDDSLSFNTVPLVPVSQPTFDAPRPSRSPEAPLPSPSLQNNGLSSALERVRQAWVVARHALWGTGTSSAPAIPASALPSASTRTNRTRIDMIERVQENLLALRSVLRSTPPFVQDGSILSRGRRFAASCAGSAPLSPAAPLVPDYGLETSHTLMRPRQHLATSSTAGHPSIPSPVSCFPPRFPPHPQFHLPGSDNAALSLFPHLDSATRMPPYPLLAASCIHSLSSHLAAFFYHHLPPSGHCAFASEHPRSGC
ncbi:hypothetical protein A4X13_0g8023 [Tilletia indica]|uniref:FHA domain-containing protein n=1 Tax=Tilletia indica TaxID=43049 RepID=A0A177T3D3_9BASI|nr:hypothetical protein A4X13_0g8023 [Tilletia indica]